MVSQCFSSDSERQIQREVKRGREGGRRGGGRREGKKKGSQAQEPTKTQGCRSTSGKR